MTVNRMCAAIKLIPFGRQINKRSFFRLSGVVQQQEGPVEEASRGQSTDGV